MHGRMSRHKGKHFEYILNSLKRKTFVWNRMQQGGSGGIWFVYLGGLPYCWSKSPLWITVKRTHNMLDPNRGSKSALLFMQVAFPLREAVLGYFM